MTKPNHTGLKDPLPSEVHRTLGSKTYMTDIDCLEFTFDSPDSPPRPVAIIDDKHGSAETLSLKYAPMRMQLWLAEHLQIPMFLAISFLHEATPCYYVVAANERACQVMREFLGKETDRDWFSVKRYSQLQHHLRGLTWSAQELGHLSESVKKYSLPQIDL